MERIRYSKKDFRVQRSILRRAALDGTNNPPKGSNSSESQKYRLSIGDALKCITFASPYSVKNC